MPLAFADSFSGDCVARMSECKTDIKRCFAKIDGTSAALDLELNVLEGMLTQLRRQQLANASAIINLAHRSCTTIQCFWTSYRRRCFRIRNVCALVMQSSGRRFLAIKKRRQVEKDKSKLGLIYVGLEQKMKTI